MNKLNYFNVIDFGKSKLGLYVFDKNLNEIYKNHYFLNDKTKKNDLEENYVYLKDLIKKAEKNISEHLEEFIVSVDTPNTLIIDLSLKKNLEKKTSLEKIYTNLNLEVGQLINNNYDNYFIMHVITNKIITDGAERNYLNNKNVLIKNIIIEFKIICYPKELINKISKIFLKNNLEVRKFYCGTYLKSTYYSKKYNNDKKFFLDIGFERASLLYFEGDKLKYLNSISVGGNHITKDISKVFKIEYEVAENIKKSFNKSETEFSYIKNINNNEAKFFDKIIKNNISIDTLKKVVLYRIQEIIDLSFRKLKKNYIDFEYKNIELILIGGGSKLFDKNSFHLNDQFNIKSLSYYDEKLDEICRAALDFYLNNDEIKRKNNKKKGFFEIFFNFFSK